MNIYASKRNPMFDAPCIGICIDGSELIEMSPGTIAYPHTECEPHYLARQRNEPNRVLLHIRKNWDGHSPATKRSLITIHLSILKGHTNEHAGGDGYLRLTDDTLAMIDHARRVLTRLARFQETTR